MTSAHIIKEVSDHQLTNHSHRIQVDAQPYQWPYDRSFNPNTTALLIIDMQRDFLEPGGYIHSMGYSLAGTRAAIEPIKQILTKMRKMGFHIIHTREGHRPNLSDCYPVKHWRSMNTSSLGIGDEGPLGKLLVRGEKGWEIIEELEPIPDEEVIIDKHGKGAFHATELETVLKSQHIKNLILTGVTTDVCVHTTLREANDRGFECLLITDGTAALDPEVHWAAVKSVHLSGGIFGATCDSRTLLSTLDKMESLMAHEGLENSSKE
eukprot:TRINITY_DN1061_c0_g1_i5.p1 TRINITY_DN1061_c0_g1~~TRINITY_DN1061_c0_g1_i5.p1  ORF type:complete len:265 (+),score=72.27 TRINITY_DN1061_c0_g1_i5:334-1128(+)